MGSRSVTVALSCLLSQAQGVHLTEIILKVWVINGQNVVDLYICEFELR